MNPRKAHFPWGTFELWLREGISAGCILNKVMIASWPKNKWPAGCQPISEPEERELLHKLVKWTTDSGVQRTVKFLLEKIESNGGEYPKLSDNEAKALWLGLATYGTSTKHYSHLNMQLKSYFTHFEDTETVINRMMDCMWRAIGPSMDPDRKAIENSVKESY